MYCLVRGDLLDYDVSQKAVDSLHTLMQDYPRKESKGLVLSCVFILSSNLINH